MFLQLSRRSSGGPKSPRADIVVVLACFGRLDRRGVARAFQRHAPFLLGRSVPAARTLFARALGVHDLVAQPAAHFGDRFGDRLLEEFHGLRIVVIEAVEIGEHRVREPQLAQRRLLQPLRHALSQEHGEIGFVGQRFDIGQRLNIHLVLRLAGMVHRNRRRRVRRLDRLRRRIGHVRCLSRRLSAFFRRGFLRRFLLGFLLGFLPRLMLAPRPAQQQAFVRVVHHKKLQTRIPDIRKS